ncbi:carboxylate-amine ligase [Desulforhopalus singaporensis]|uniref:Putative glutamate--cysteine ligase 2 n=1 Tax=Desulforhopalus singaporensis TaxID=91360 RepID=A0A1H0MRW2_9BACT|nr:YbdK family carboxylate-amine ligase [Desulforhopalus singaporensis]SDO83189.1 carboxylate-amine ligase [Desulforhopalus singaporensis]
MKKTEQGGLPLPDDGPSHRFAISPRYTLGVEIEFQTLDMKSWDLAPMAPILLQNAPSLLRPRLSPEFIQSILEIRTGVCFSLHDVENDLMQTISLAEELAVDNGCRLFSASLHPFASHSDQLLTTNKRYAQIMDQLQIVGRRFIAQGLHVHVGMPDGDTAVRVNNKIQAYLPILLSLSTSSPFSQSEDTGLMSYRTKLFEALPLAGIYTYLAGWADLVRELDLLKAAGVINSFKDLWWDARPNPEFGTVEIRICDLPFRFNDILAITALIQALAATLAEQREPAAPLDHYILQANKWQAARYGLDGEFLDPSGWLGGRRMSFRSAVVALLRTVIPMTVRLGSERYAGLVEPILSNGTGADYMRKKFTETGNLKEVIRSLQGEFWK